MSGRSWLIVGFALVIFQISLLYFLGQPLVCDCGYVKVWEGVVLSAGNSQHLLDWYSFSHVIHGFIFYALLRYLFPDTPFFTRLAIAVGIEVGWEVLENTPLVIEHYRQQALAVGYSGDSIVNSVSDTLMMVAGFVLARRLPIAATVAVALILEIFTLYMIRDSLALNVLGFFFTPEFIGNWQNAS